MGPIAGLKWNKIRKQLHQKNAFRLEGIDECGVSFLNIQGPFSTCVKKLKIVV